MGCHTLLQGIFLAQGSNVGLQHCGQILYHLRHQGSQESIKSGVRELMVYVCTAQYDSHHSQWQFTFKFKLKKIKTQFFSCTSH